MPESEYVQTGARQFIECEIKWDDTDSVDTSVLGRTTLRGEVIAPDGYEFEGGLEPVIEIPIFIYSEGMEPMENAAIAYDSSTLLLIPTGSSPAEYVNTADQYSFMTDSGDYFYCTATWEDLPAADTAGEITLTGTYNLPWGISTDTPFRTQTFYAMNDDDIYLDYILNDGFFVSCYWLKYIEDYENISIQYSCDGGEWLDGSEICEVGGDYFNIYAFELDCDASYLFRLEYNGKTYGNLLIDTTDDDVSAAYISGDIDGGDNEQQELSDYTTPTESSVKRKHSNNKTVSTVEQTIAAAEESTTEQTTTAPISELESTQTENDIEPPVIEEITPNKTTISGSKLIEAVKTQGDYITFEKDGTALELPPDFVKDSNITPNDSVTVEIKRDDKNISLNVEVNNEPVNNIEGSRLRLSDKTEEIKKNEATIKDTSDDDRYSEFEIDEAGTYTAETDNGQNSINYKLFVIAGIIILAAGTVFIKWLSTKK